jgi:type I restriction-modification system DNA methylase subunit
MNMALHGVEDANVAYRDSLAEDHAEDAGAYSLVLANPPFAGSLDNETVAKDLLQIVKTKKTELLFLALFLRLLKVGGRAAVIVPDGVLFGSSKAHKDLRRMLVEDNKLDAVIKLPSGVFRPCAGVSTAILVFTRTGVGGTDFVWFYDVKADGWSLDDKRQPLLAAEKLGPTPATELDEADEAKNNLPDVLMRWEERNAAERGRPRTAQSFVCRRRTLSRQPTTFRSTVIGKSSKWTSITKARRKSSPTFGGSRKKFPRGWRGLRRCSLISERLLRIQDFCRTGSGATPSRSKENIYFGGDIPWVKSGELREGPINETEETVTERALKETSLKLVPPGAVLVAMLM